MLRASRFRPIVMTALAFIVGCLPLWTASGSGAASRRILGTVVVGGMTLSTMLGLIFIPVTFAVVEFLSHRFVRGGQGTTMDSMCGPGTTPGVPIGAEPGTGGRPGMMSLLEVCTIKHLGNCVRASCRLQCRSEVCAAKRYGSARAYRGADGTAVSSDAKNSLGDEQWAAVYREPELQELIRKALANNYDVRIAAKRILEQQAQVQITRSQEFPSITVGGTGVGATLPGSLGTQIASPLVSGCAQCLGCMDSGLLGLLSETNGGCARAIAGAGMGTAGSPVDAGATGGHCLSADSCARRST